MQKNGVLKQEKECKNFLRENYGLKKGEFDEIILELKDSNALKWWNEILFDYFLEKTEKGDFVALAIKEKFRLDELDFIELRKLLQNDDFISVLNEFWQSDMF